jgi:hypothetical protein
VPNPHARRFLRLASYLVLSVQFFWPQSSHGRCSACRKTSAHDFDLSPLGKSEEFREAPPWSFTKLGRKAPALQAGETGATGAIRAIHAMLTRRRLTRILARVVAGFGGPTRYQQFER